MITQKKMLYLFMALCAAVAGCLPIAAQRQDDTPLRAAADQFYRKAATRRAAANATSQVASQHMLGDGQPAWCAYNYGDGEGYVIMAANGAEPVALGYALQGRLDSTDMPPALCEWLTAVEQLAAQGMPLEVSNQAATHPVVEPLLDGIQWGQGSPYNSQTPINSKSEEGEHCAAGCVAVAMAQVMYYHQWPLQGEGQHSYTFYQDSEHYSADFGNTTYQWDKMLPSLTEESPQEAIDAVSTLLLHAGISVEMFYSTASGAATINIAPALYNYFRYDQGISHRDHRYYTNDEWLRLIDTELAAGRPVIYSGFTQARPILGHAFVCDGADGQGYYHINWGWNGSDNGYFRMNMLTPQHLADKDTYEEGTGFDTLHEMVIGIQPRREDSKPHHEICCSGLRLNRKTSIPVGGTFDLSLTIRDYSIIKEPVLYYFTYTDQSNETQYVSSPEEKTCLPVPATLLDGEYDVELWYCTEDGTDSGRVRLDPNYSQKYLLSIHDGQADLSVPEYYNIYLKDISCYMLKTWEENTISLLIENTGGNYTGSFFFRIKHPLSGQQYQSPTYSYVDVPAHSEQSLEWVVPISLPADDGYQIELWQGLNLVGVINDISIVDGDMSAVHAIEQGNTSNHSTSPICNLLGQRISTVPHKGLNIIRTKDGQTRKVLVR